MPKAPILRWLLLGSAGILLLLAVVAVVAYLRFDPQSLGPQIATRIEQATGRKATIGTLSLTLFPAPAVSIAPVTIANAGSAGGDALRIESVAIRVRPWPLLRGRLELGAIVIDRPALTLARDRQGRWSFADILETIAAKPKEPAATTGDAPDSPSGFTVGVEKVAVRGARIQISDEAVVPGKRSELAIAPVAATVSGWGMGGATSFDLSAGLGKSVLHVTAQLTAEGKSQNLDLAVPASRVELADLIALLPWLGVAQPDGLALAGTVTVEGKATMPLDRVAAVNFQGIATVDGASYSDATMKRPIERIGGKLTITGDRAQFDDFKAVLGNSDLNGRLEIENFMKPRIEFGLESTRLDLNQILETFAGGGAPSTPDANANATETARASSGAPGDGLLNIRAKGSLAVKAMRFQTFDVGEVRGTLHLERAVMTLDDVQATLYGGKLRGRGSVDLARATPRNTFDVSLDGVDVNGAASAFDPTLKDILRGSLRGDLSLEADGLAMDPILDTARGQAKIEIAKGSLTSISILKKLATLLEAAGGKGIGKDETPFESLRGSFAIGGGKAVTDDLTLDSADLDMTGRGTVGLDASLDLKAVPSLSAEATKGMVDKTPTLGRLVDAQGRLTLHMIAKGNLAAPSITLDLSAQTRDATDKLKQDAEVKVKKKLQDKLKGLFK